MIVAPKINCSGGGRWFDTFHLEPFHPTHTLPPGVFYKVVQSWGVGGVLLQSKPTKTNQMNTATKPLQGTLTLIGAAQGYPGLSTFYGPVKPQGRNPAKYAVLVHSTGELVELEASEFLFVPDNEPS